MENTNLYSELTSNPNWKETIDLSDESLSKFDRGQLKAIAIELNQTQYSQKAFIIYKYCADHFDDRDSAANVGHYLLHGLYSPEYAYLFENAQLEAVNYLIKASNLNHIAASLTLADLYKEGNIVVEDIEKELHYRLKVVNQGINDFDNYLRLAHIYVLLEDYKNALYYFQIAKENCFASETAMINYLNGQINDLQKYENIAKKYNVYYGNNVVRDKYYVKAVEERKNGNYAKEYSLYEKSANSGNVSSYVEMALMLINENRGIERDKAKGIELLQKASSLGNDKAKYLLACHYVESDPARAYELYKESKKTFNDDRFHIDAEIEYFNDHLDEALRLYDIAFEYGAYDMDYTLYCIDGILSDPRINRKDLLPYYAYQASKKDVENANEIMAKCFENGYGVNVDNTLAQAFRNNDANIKRMYDFSNLEIKPDFNNLQQVEIKAKEKTIIDEVKSAGFSIFKGIYEGFKEGIEGADLSNLPKISIRQTVGSPSSSSGSSFDTSGNYSNKDADQARIDARNHRYDNTNYSSAYQNEFARNLSYEQYQKYKNGEDPFGY